MDDITLPGMYFGVTIRSPVAKGRLKGIEFSSMPFYTLITAETIPGVNQLEGFSVPILASDELSYIGEPVAILVGPQENKLREYAKHCKVIAEEDSPVFSDIDGEAGCIAAERRFSMPQSPEEDPANTISGTYKTGIQEHWYADPHGAIAVFSEGRLTVYVAGQWPFHIKRSVVQATGLPAEAVLVEPARMGMHLDGKIWYPSLMACHAALGALASKKPVKLILTKEEDFFYSPKRNAGEITMHSILGKKGVIKTDVKIAVDLGAYGVFADEIIDRTCLGSLGVYTLGQTGVEALAGQSNIPPQGPLAGFGLSQGFFALERQVSRIADAQGVDPAEWRKAHVRQDPVLAIGVPIEEPPLTELIDTVSAMSGYYRKWSAYQLLRMKRRASDWQSKEEPIRGIGLAAAYQGNGFLYSGTDQGVYAVELTLEAEGFLNITTSMVSSNYTYIRNWREMAGEILSIEGELIRIRLGSTDTAPDCGPGSNSRNVASVTQLVEEGCREIQRRRGQEPLPITIRQAYTPGLKSPWEKVSLAPLERRFDEGALVRLGWGCAVVEVEIDPADHTPRIRGVWLCVEGGRILSEDRARLTLTQAGIHALGWAAREHLCYVHGKIQDPLFYGYDIPAPGDLPPIQVGFLRRDTSFPKGIGELPFSTVPAAYVQAVSQALDHPFDRIPLTSRDVWKTGKLKRREP